MSDETIPYYGPQGPNPDLAPAGPAITQEDGATFEIDGRRTPNYSGSPCTGCKHFWFFGTASESRQVYKDKDGKDRRRLFLTWHRQCAWGPELVEMADDLVAYCNRFTPDVDSANRWHELSGKEAGKNPEIVHGDGEGQ